MVLYVVVLMWPELIKEEGCPPLTMDDFLYMYSAGMGRGCCIRGIT